MDRRRNKNYIFCGKGWDNWELFVKECEIARDWFIELEKDEERRLERIWDENLHKRKGYVLRNFWIENEKAKMVRKEKRDENKEIDTDENKIKKR